MRTLRLVSLLAANALPFYRGVAQYLNEHAGLPVVLVEGPPWHEQERMLDAGHIDLAFLCGLVYTRKAAHVDLLAAPVMRGARYAARPIYFSDVVVARASQFAAFESLRGVRWLYNDRGSFSGYAILRAHLAALGETGEFCGPIVESGGHLRSLALVASGMADAAAIDSTVLDLELQQRPGLAEQIRVVASLGPHPIPPAVIGKHVPAGIAEQLRAALLRMHQDPAGRTALAAGVVDRFVTIADADYDAIRATAQRADQVQLNHLRESR
jgi:phosphonate transport system substrate-binding protein